jgi:rhodanese-related sulfurtransferase
MAVQSISLESVRQRLLCSGSLLLIDVRTPGEYARLHAQGAHSVPLDRLNPDELQAMRNRLDEPLYVICQSGARAARACEQLADAGVTDVYSVAGGTVAWEKAGLPVERGAGTISLERQARIAAGSLVALGTALGWSVHLAFLIVPLFVGVGLVFAGITDYCGMGMLIAKLPWNK